MQVGEDDHEGSVTQLTDASGVVIESYRYDAFGAVTIKDGNGNVQTLNGLPYSPLGNRFLFTGREYIQQFGIYEWSDLGRGVWMGSDLHFPQMA